MIVVSGTALLKQEYRDASIAAAKSVVELTVKEAGCISYAFYTDIANPCRLRVFEEWESEEALNAHLAADHTQAFLASLPEALAEAPDIRRYFISDIKPL